MFVLDEHNIEYDLTRRTAQAPGSLTRKMYSAANWRKLRSEERAAWQRVDGVVLTSERDAELLRRTAGQKRWSYPTASTSRRSNPRHAARARHVTVPGRDQLLPNTDGILHFLDNTWPLIVAARPGRKLQIVGMGPPESVLSRRSDNVEVTGSGRRPPALPRARNRWSWFRAHRRWNALQGRRSHGHGQGHRIHSPGRRRHRGHA